MAEKTSPRPPAGDHGNGRDPSKTLGKTKVSCRSAAGNGVACWGPIWATWEILRKIENLEKPLVKQRFGAGATKWQKRKHAQ